MKKPRVKDQFLEGLRETPNITIVCKRLDISRNTIYRWKHEDEQFCVEMDLALYEGEDHFNDVAESKMMEKVMEGDMAAIKLRLSKCSPKYSDHKIDDVLIADAKEKKHKKDYKLLEEIKVEIKKEKFKTSYDVPAICKPHELELMLKMGLIDWKGYESGLKFSKEMEKQGITTEDQSKEIMEKMDPTTEEILVRYEERTKEVRDQIFKKRN